MVFCPFLWLLCLPEGTNMSFIVHLLNLHQVSNGEQVVVWGRYVKHSVRKSCPERNSYEIIFVKLFEISILLRHVRWQLPLHDKSSPSFAPIRGELVVDKLGSSVRTSITFPDWNFVLQKFSNRLNLIFWIVIGCGIACFGRRGLKPKRAIPHPITIQNMRSGQ